MILVLILIASLTSRNDVGNVCTAAPAAASVPAADPAKIGSRSLQVALPRVADVHRVDNLTRRHGGDTFIATDALRCETDTCVGLSSGTAGLFRIDENDGGKKFKATTSDDCRCQCLSHIHTFREDLNICVDDIHECTLAPFVSGSSSEKIPFVFLPLRGQIIHPSKEISFHDAKLPICAVSGSQYLTTTGWSDLRNPIDTDVPFRLFRDEGRTFLQWLGESDLRYKMQGRLILVHLMCRDMAPMPVAQHLLEENRTANNKGPPKAAPNIFSPCVAFRVVGTPVKHVNNVTEVSFQSETQTTASTVTAGLSTKEYVAIAICSLLLGLIYVASVFLYLHVKKRKSRATAEVAAALANAAPMKNDQVTFGAGFSRSGSASTFGSQIHTGGSLMSGGSRRSNSRLLQQAAAGSGGSSNGNISVEEMGIIKNNPLLKHYPNLSDTSGFTTSDMSNSNSECDDEIGVDSSSAGIMIKTMQGVMTHTANMNQIERNFGFDLSNNSNQETECLPEENVSIVEDMTSEDKLENMKAIVNGTMRRKLYFNPAYFEPHLLLTPPVAAIEFLTKIREVITIAKYKMSTKRYQPSLIMIPEENGHGHGSDTYATSYAASRRNSSVLSQTNNARRKSASSASCAGCPGCSSTESNTTGSKADANSNCKNCGDKRNSIRKWLEEVSTHESDRHAEPENEHNILDKVPAANKTHSNPSSTENGDHKFTVESGSSSDSDTIKANSIRSNNKRKAPPVPTANPPKIISHFMKKEESLKSDVNNNQKLYGKNSLQSLAEQSKIYEKLELYDQLAKSGGELFNNPQFQHGSPHLSQRSQNSRHSQKSRSKIEVLDQFSNPHQNRHYEVMKNLHQMPDMVYEAMAKDYTKRKLNNTDSVYGHISLPTPDYDEPQRGKKIYDDVPPYVHVPTPDYNTYGRTKAHPQPDSPVYTRKSPHHLIVDYETDSLERSTTTKMGRSSSTTPPSNGSDLSSQPSPSLSVALPLEEEVEVRNTVYDRVEGFRKDGIDSVPKSKTIRPKTPKAQLYEDMTTHSNYAGLQTRPPMLPPKEPRIKYNTPSQGSMTIEVEHEPSDCEVSTDSEQFEPDTLDRKPKKISLLATKNSNAAWSQHMIKSANFLNAADEKVQYSSLENMTSLPDMKNLHINGQLVLRSSGSFKSSSSLNNFTGINTLLNETSLQKSFNSLREIYEAKNAKNLSAMQANLNNLSESEKGRLLTLEARHSKRQRQTNVANTLKKPIPPDVIPSESNNTSQQHIIYDNPKTPSRPVEGPMTVRAGQKNLTGWNADDCNGQTDDCATSSDTLETSSSEATTEVTGVSDTQINSEFGSDHRKRLIHNNDNNESLSRQYSKVQKMSKFHINHGSVRKMDHDNHEDNDGDHHDERITVLENFMALGDVRNKNFTEPDQSDLSDSSTLKSDSTNFNYKKNTAETIPAERIGNDAAEADAEDMDRIEVVSSKSISLHSAAATVSNEADTAVGNVSPASIMQELAGSTRNFELNPSVRMVPTKVFRVDVNPSTHGMQIALGLKDRVKKSKDLKYAWKKFVNIATSKFHGPSSSSKASDGGHTDLDGLEKCSVLSEGDDGISSMHDESITVLDHELNGPSNSGQISRTPSSTSDASKRTTRNMRTDPDSGYMSADSNESKIHSKKLYERFNFRAVKNTGLAGVTSEQRTDSENDFAQKNMSRMQEIKESAELEKASSKSSVSGGSNKSTPTNTIDHQRPSVTGFIPKSFMLQMPGDALLQVNVYSSDDERYSSGMSSESDEEYNLEDMCESGAESVETNSVFFKNVRKSTQKGKGSDGSDKK